MFPRVLFGSNGWACGIHEIASHIVRLGMADAVIHRLGDGFLKRLIEFQPHVVGFRIEGGQCDTVCHWIQKVRQLHKTTIILGGPTATSHPIEVLQRTGADYVFAGDAEKSFEKFLFFARKDNSCDHLPDIPGLAYFWAGQPFVNLPPEHPVLGRQVPFIDEILLRQNRLNWSLWEGFNEGQPLDSLYFTGGRGCPGRCSFCARLHGQRVRTKNAQQIIEEIQGANQLVQQGKLPLTQWQLYEPTDDFKLKPLSVSWCSIFDEDFFLDKNRAVRFLQLYEFYGFQKRYRLSFQTNPCSLLDRNGKPDAEIFYWIHRLKVMIQLGAETFHPLLLQRWNKRHTPEQLELVLNELDKMGQDYNIFHILADYHTTLQELYETTSLLLHAAREHRRMRIASAAMMIPLYDTDVRRELFFTGRLRIKDFMDYETPQPDWIDSEVTAWADKIDDALQNALYPQQRDAALDHAADILSHLRSFTFF